MKLHHIAYAVSDVGKAAEAFRALGYSAEAEPIEDEERGVFIQFLTDQADMQIELVAPAREDSPVSGILAKERNSSTPYHMCYETTDMDAELSRLRGAGFVQTKPRMTAPAIGGRDVVFAFSPHAGLIELVESER